MRPIIGQNDRAKYCLSGVTPAMIKQWRLVLGRTDTSPPPLNLRLDSSLRTPIHRNPLETKESGQLFSRIQILVVSSLCNPSGICILWDALDLEELGGRCGEIPSNSRPTAGYDILNWNTGDYSPSDLERSGLFLINSVRVHVGNKTSLPPISYDSYLPLVSKCASTSTASLSLRLCQSLGVVSQPTPYTEESQWPVY